MPRLPLTDEQRGAVLADSDRLFIEAAPGTGKTTVAAERYGVLRFNGSSRSHRAIRAMSFTRSATGELHRRVRSRWGSSAISWPHGVMTIDSLIYRIVEHLLRQGVIGWPGDHTSLEVLDHWRGHRGCRWLDAGNYRRVATISASGMVTSMGRRVRTPRLGIGSRADFHSHLSRGRCTHEEIREVLVAALTVYPRVEVIADFLSSSVTHLVVDEVFDANRLDLALVELARSGNIAVTLVGDPWQALYGFRGARPELVPDLLARLDFAAVPLSHSFRFQSQEMKELSTALREGRSVTLAPGDGYEVVLASQWDQLWEAPNNILPLSFGRTTNKTDAAAIVLLDYLVSSAFGHRAIFLPEALVLLDLDPNTFRERRASVLGSVAEILARSTGGAPVRALRALREAMRELGAPRRPPAGSDDNEQRQLDRLVALRARLLCEDTLVPGMTIHQAKGREWDRVGIRLTPGEAARLAARLDRSVEGDRALYVALTRARYEVRAVN